MHSHINLVKLPILDGMSFEGSEVGQNDEALQLLLMVMSGPHVLDEVHEQFQTRVSKIRVSVFESSGISVTPDRGPSFQGYQVYHPLHHDRAADRINLEIPLLAGNILPYLHWI